MSAWQEFHIAECAVLNSRAVIESFAEDLAIYEVRTSDVDTSLLHNLLKNAAIRLMEVLSRNERANDSRAGMPHQAGSSALTRDWATSA